MDNHDNTTRYTAPIYLQSGSLQPHWSVSSTFIIVGKDWTLSWGPKHRLFVPITSHSETFSLHIVAAYIITPTVTRHCTVSGHALSLCIIDHAASMHTECHIAEFESYRIGDSIQDGTLLGLQPCHEDATWFKRIPTAFSSCSSVEQQLLFVDSCQPRRGDALGSSDGATSDASCAESAIDTFTPIPRPPLAYSTPTFQCSILGSFVCNFTW
jgi:hypothetical protein